MGTTRLTSASASSAPHPVVELTYVSATAPKPAPKVRLSSVTAGFVPPSTAIVRLTSVSLDRVIAGVPPTSSAGSDISAGAGELWVLDGSDSSSNGTIVSRLWTQSAKSPSNAPDLELSDPRVASPSFVAPVTTTGASYVMAYKVVEDTGLASDPDEVTVQVSAADRAIATATGWVPAGRLVATATGWV